MRSASYLVIKEKNSTPHFLHHIIVNAYKSIFKIAHLNPSMPSITCESSANPSRVFTFENADTISSQKKKDQTNRFRQHQSTSGFSKHDLSNARVQQMFNHCASKIISVLRNKLCFQVLRSHDMITELYQ